MTWEELLEHMDNLSGWGHEELKAWAKRAAGLVQENLKGMSCQKQELHHRAQVQNKLAGICEDMCKEVGAYPKCTCPGFTPPDATPGVMTWDELLEHMCKELGAYPMCAGCPNFVAPDSTPGVMTWDELLEHMDNLSEWGHGEIKAWTKRAANLIQENLSGMSCDKQELHHRAAVQNKLAGICEDMCKEVGAYPKCTCPGFT